jgi:hypothetical protein
MDRYYGLGSLKNHDGILMVIGNGDVSIKTLNASKPREN